MNLYELRSLVRRRTRDNGNPPLWSDDEIDGNLNEAERETCVRALLIEDDSSSITQIDTSTDEKRYAIDPRIIDVISIEAASAPGVAIFGWSLTEGYLVLDRLPAKEDTLTLRCYRLPLADMVDDSDSPEIRAMYHERMADWAISLCYMAPDAECFDQHASDRYAARFTQSFGDRHNANSVRNFREKADKTVTCGNF